MNNPDPTPIDYSIGQNTMNAEPMPVNATPMPIPKKTNFNKIIFVILSVVIVGLLGIVAVLAYSVSTLMSGTRPTPTGTITPTSTIAVTVTPSIQNTIVVTETTKPSATQSVAQQFSETLNGVNIGGTENSVIVTGSFVQNPNEAIITHSVIQDGVAQVVRIKGTGFQLNINVSPNNYGPIGYQSFVSIQGSKIANLGRIEMPGTPGYWVYVDDKSNTTCTRSGQPSVNAPCGYMSTTKGGPGYYDIRCPNGSNVIKCDAIAKTIDITIVH